ncbi:MAG: hypothetical protein HY747_02650 [Elusimicrobia bacterium]|nr:hypothetical protein [Elusimicrobiota bacterium]
MSRKIYFLRAVFVLIACLPALPAEAAPAVTYTVRADPRLQSEVVFIQGKLSDYRANPIIYFYVLDSLGPASSLNLIKELEFAGQDRAALAAEKTGPGIWKVSNPSRGPIYFQYSLRTDQKAHGLSMDVPGGGEMPRLNDNFFFTSGAVSFVQPKLTTDAPVAIRWKIPDAWSIITPWVTKNAVTSIPRLTDLANNFLSAGKVRTAVRSLGTNFSFEIAWLGKENIKDQVVEQFGGIFKAANEIFGGPTRPKYLLIFKPLTEPGPSPASAKADSIQFYIPMGVTPEETIQFKENMFLPPILLTLAHEYAHTWAKERIKSGDFTTDSKTGNGGNLRWMIEGFTDYIGHLILLRSGVIDAENLANAMQRIFLELKNFPAYEKISLLEASQGFFNSQEKNGLIYTGGCLLALRLDLALRLGRAGPGKNLIKFMRQYYSPILNQPNKSPLERFLSSWKAYAGKNLTQELEQAIQEPVHFNFYEMLRSAGVTAVATKAMAGYDGNVENNDGVPKTVIVGPNAQAQGLRKGDIILSVNSRSIRTKEEFYERLSTAPTPVEIWRSDRAITLQLQRIPFEINKLQVKKGSLWARLAALN